jgi:hypothetical protein
MLGAGSRPERGTSLAPFDVVHPDVAAAAELMMRFAGRTAGARRYLWTDAFAVCNLLELARASGENRHLEAALRLIDDVHHTLGLHRADDTRRGWISCLTAADAEAHPTAGGLRIGKPLPERRAGEAMDERLEWDRDGQYFHYATKWMHALDQTARAVGQPMFNTWARELALAAYRGFTHLPRAGGGRRMYWKMSIDLSRPLVASMGQHDPLDGFLTCMELEATARELLAPGPSLAEAASDFAAMVDPAGLVTTDPLGIGGLLVDACRAAQLGRWGALDGHGALVATLLDAALTGLQGWVAQGELRLPATGRLAFRELGLVIGLATLPLLGDVRQERATGAALESRLAAIARFAPLGAALQAFWLRAEHRRMETWRAHEDINDVMLATALLPEGFLILRPRGG